MRRRGLNMGMGVGGDSAVPGDGKVVDMMQKDSARSRAWSTGPGVVSCDGDWLTEEYQRRQF
jgi:hypothetical protein